MGNWQGMKGDEFKCHWLWTDRQKIWHNKDLSQQRFDTTKIWHNKDLIQTKIWFKQRFDTNKDLTQQGFEIDTHKIKCQW